MLREQETELLSFCTRQQSRLDEVAWFNAVTDREVLAVVAFLLASVSWYGHRGSLLTLAEKLHKNCAEDFTTLVVEHEFDCSRFVAMLREQLTRGQLIA